MTGIGIRTITGIALSLGAMSVDATQATAQSLVDKIKQRGYVSCGASTGVPGLSRADENGVWRGFDSDVCRAFAVALFGDKDKIRFVPLVTAARLPAIQTGEIDVLSRTTTVTYTRDAAVRFTAITLYDNDAILSWKKLNLKQIKDFEGASFCVTGGGNLSEKSLTELEAEYKIKVKRVVFESPAQSRDSYFAGRCDAYITDGTAAAGAKVSVAKNPDDHDLMALTEHAPEPLGIAIPRGDDRWFDIVRWSIFALWWAEDNGVTSANIDEKLKSGDKNVQRVLGAVAGFGKPVGLDDKWVYNIIKQVGNYAEIWDRNLGKDTPIKLERKFNNLYKNGGLMFSPPWD